MEHPSIDGRRSARVAANVRNESKADIRSPKQTFLGSFAFNRAVGLAFEYAAFPPWPSKAKWPRYAGSPMLLNS
jgi:hypothetical protein